MSAPRSVVYFACPDLSLPMRSPGSECPRSATFFLCPNLSFPTRRPLQRVSPPHLVTFFPCHDLSLLIRSPGGECPSFGHFSFRVLTCPSPCDLQSVSAPILFNFILYLDFIPPFFQGVSFPSICSSIFHVLSAPSSLHFSGGEPFFVSAFSLFSLFYFSVTQLLFDKLRSFNSDVL